jgi:hypothetical protein
VRAAYIDKKRSDAHTVEMAGGLLTGPGRPLELAPGQSFEDAAAFVLDDETAQGSTLLSATYALVKRMGLSWQRVYTGVIQGKLNRGLEPLDSGWSAEELKSARLPANIDDARGRMPPYRFFATESIHLPDELRGSKVSLRSLVAEIIGKIDGKD